MAYFFRYSRKGGCKMRTSRISGSSVRVYRKNHNLPTADQAMFHSNMQQRLHQHLEQRSKKKKEKMKQQHKLVNQKSRLIVKGILFANEKSPQIHNQLLQNAQMIHTSTKMKVRNHVYKNSI